MWERGDPVTSIRLKYLLQDRDRHGKVRFYVRMKGKRKIRIRAAFGTEEFISAYSKALSETADNEPRTQAGMPRQGSFGRACLNYYASPTLGIWTPAQKIGAVVTWMRLPVNMEISRLSRWQPSMSRS